MVGWRDGLSRWLGDRLDGPLDWDESGPAPCFTDKPGWDGYGGTLLLAAHDEYPRPAGAGPGVRRQARRPRLPGRLGPPGRVPLPPAPHPRALAPQPVRLHVRTPDITGEEVELGSSVALLDQLELLSTRYRLDGQPPDPATDGHSLSAAAGNGLAVLLRLAERSVINRVPMKLDF